MNNNSEGWALKEALGSRLFWEGEGEGYLQETGKELVESDLCSQRALGAWGHRNVIQTIHSE